MNGVECWATLQSITLCHRLEYALYPICFFCATLYIASLLRGTNLLQMVLLYILIYAPVEFRLSMSRLVPMCVGRAALERDRNLDDRADEPVPKRPRTEVKPRTDRSRSRERGRCQIGMSLSVCVGFR